MGSSDFHQKNQGQDLDPLLSSDEQKGDNKDASPTNINEALQPGISTRSQALV